MGLINGIVFRLFRNRSFNGGRVLMLTTVGARSGAQRRSLLGCFPDGDNAWIIVGSAGGAARHPAWIFNLAKHPGQVGVEIGNRKIKVDPETLTGDARAQAWRRIVAASPGYGLYEKKTDREIPLVRLTAVG
jgi:deazaflavin-dependent oxidoreductase (nitroreductase family)